MKRTFAIIVLAALPTFLHRAPAPLNPADVVERARPSIVRVTFNAEKGTHVCGGFVVDSARGWVLSAAHCVSDNDTNAVDGTASWIVYQDDELAILGIEPMSAPPLELAKDVRLGETAIACGMAFGEGTVLVRHIAQVEETVAVRYPEIADYDIALDGWLAPGMSGGPVLNDRGEVVMISEAGLDPIFGHAIEFGLGLGPDAMREFLKAAARH